MTEPRGKQLTMQIENTVLHYLVMAYPVLISIGRFLPMIGTLLTFTLLCVLIMENLYSGKFWVKYFLIAILLTISAGISLGTENHIAHIKVLLIFFLSMDSCFRTFYIKCEKLINRYRKVLLIQIFIILAINFMFFFTKLGYSNNYTQDWGFSAFQGIYNDPHQAAYHLCALLVLLLWISKYEYHFSQWILIVGIEYCILMTGARVPTVLGIVLGGIFCLDHRMQFKANTEIISKILSYIPLVILGILALFFIMENTSFGAKMMSSVASESFDNGRSNLRKMDIDLFNSSSTICKLFGNGTDTVIQSHKGPYNDAIWSHNDYMQILCGMGAIMFVIYCKQWLSALSAMIKRKEYLGTLCILVCMLVAFYNGLYIHSRFVFVMPLLFLYFYSRNNKTINNQSDL